MTGYCRGAQMYVQFPCPAKACPNYSHCWKIFEFMSQKEKR